VLSHPDVYGIRIRYPTGGNHCLSYGTLAEALSNFRSLVVNNKDSTVELTKILKVWTPDLPSDGGERTL
jgi:hypothetical protein